MHAQYCLRIILHLCIHVHAWSYGGFNPCFLSYIYVADFCSSIYIAVAWRSESKSGYNNVCLCESFSIYMISNCCEHNHMIAHRWSNHCDEHYHMIPFLQCCHAWAYTHAYASNLSNLFLIHTWAPLIRFIHSIIVWIGWFKLYCCPLALMLLFWWLLSTCIADSALIGYYLFHCPSCLDVLLSICLHDSISEKLLSVCKSCYCSYTCLALSMVLVLML